MKRKQMEQLLDAMSKEVIFRDGDRVRINAAKITARRDFENKTNKYREWVYANSDKTVTVHRVNTELEHSLIEFVEDRSAPKWLWWDGDLVRVKI